MPSRDPRSPTGRAAAGSAPAPDPADHPQSAARADRSGPAPARGAVGALADLGGPLEPWWQRLSARSPGLRLVGEQPAMRMVATLALVAVVAAGLGAATFRFWDAGGGAPAAATAGLPMATRTPARGSGADGPPPSAPGTTAGDVWVAVAGAVVRPGLYRAVAGMRLSALIAAAGGLAPDADADRVNLAAVVRDGERVYIPRRGEPGAPPIIAGGEASAPGAGPPAGATGRPTGSDGPVPGPIDLNRASAEELDRLPGIGPATAAAIIGHRTAKGPFTSVDELADVRGIGPARLEQLRPLVVVR